MAIITANRTTITGCSAAGLVFCASAPVTNGKMAAPSWPNAAMKPLRKKDDQGEERRQGLASCNGHEVTLVTQRVRGLHGGGVEAAGDDAGGDGHDYRVGGADGVPDQTDGDGVACTRISQVSTAGSAGHLGWQWGRHSPTSESANQTANSRQKAIPR